MLARRVIIRVAAVVVIIIAVVVSLNYSQCSKQEVAQRKQDIRSQKAGTKTAKETLDRVIERYNTETHTREVITQGQTELDNEKDFRNFRGDVLDSACRLPDYRDHPSCQLP